MDTSVEANSSPLNPKALRLLPYLRCPRTGTKLSIVGDQLISEDGTQQYPIVNGKPILVKTVRDLHITPPANNIISKNVSYYRPATPVDADSWVLHLGCGEVPSNEPNVISLDILPTQAADIVAEGEALPFANETFGSVESAAVFEHVFDPMAVIKECRRVVKEGGFFRTDTAFMQPYHGFPAHYFNMTPVAVERYFADDFELVSSSISKTANPGTATLLTIDRLLLAIGSQKAAELRRMPLSDVIDLLMQNRRDGKFTENLSPYHTRGMATGTIVVSRKPVGYEERHSILEGENAAIMTAAKNDYYELRQQIYWVNSRISEIVDEIESLGGEKISAAPLPDVEASLSIVNKFDRLDPQAWQEAVTMLKGRKMDANNSLILWQRALSRARANKT